jgi:hypothetical protein
MTVRDELSTAKNGDMGSSPSATEKKDSSVEYDSHQWRSLENSPLQHLYAQKLI